MQVAVARDADGAAAVGACAGFALLGPVSAVVGAGAMAYGTTRRDGVGSACSGAGKMAANAYSSVKRWNREHAVTTKAAAACATGAKAVKKLDDEYKIREKTAKAVTGTARAASEFNEKHGVTKKIGEGVSVGLAALSASLVAYARRRAVISARSAFAFVRIVVVVAIATSDVARPRRTSTARACASTARRARVDRRARRRSPPCEALTRRSHAARAAPQVIL